MLWVHLQTIFSFRSYQRLLFVPRKIVIGFAVYLWLVSLLVFYIFASGFITKNTAVFLKNFPQVTFEKGVLTTPQEPVYASLPGGNFKIGFDAARQVPPTSQELLENNTLALVVKNTVYMPGSGPVQTRPLPDTLSFTTTPEFLAQHQKALASGLKLTALLGAFFIIPFVFLFDFCIALSACLFFNLATRRFLPHQLLLHLAVFLQGPLAVLWYVRLWYPVPLFTLAQVILCIIYVQQIFNLMPEGKLCK